MNQPWPVLHQPIQHHSLAMQQPPGAVRMNSELDNITSYQSQANDWAQLARQDPDAFEAMRTKLVNEFIKNSPAEMQQRLECVQWKIEHVRKRADNPADAFMAISGMMWESTQQLERQHKALINACSCKEINSLSHNGSAKVLNFKRTANQ